MHPHLFSLGLLSIKMYGLLVAVGFLLGTSWASWQAKKRDIPPELVMDIALISMVCGVLGARLFYVALNWQYFANQPLEIIMIHRGGLVLYGGLIMAIAGDLIYLKWQNAPIWEIADIAGPTACLGQAAGRLGCFFNGCCYGLPTGSFFGVNFPPGSAAFYQYPGVAITPIQLVATLINLGLFAFLWWRLTKRHFQGQIFSLYGILYSVYRFGIEFARGDVERGFYGTLSTSQWISICFCLFFMWLYWHRQKATQ